jgi:hypothetical protein
MQAQALAAKTRLAEQQGAMKTQVMQQQTALKTDMMHRQHQLKSSDMMQKANERRQMQQFKMQQPPRPGGGAGGRA